MMQISEEIRAKNLYEVLGLNNNTASRKELSKVYRVLTLKFHPDKNPGDIEAAKKFKEIKEAYEVLGNADPSRRKQYDHLSHYGPHSSKDSSEEKEIFPIHASFLAQMRFLILINLMNICT